MFIWVCEVLIQTTFLVLSVGVLTEWLLLWTSGCSMACGVLADEGLLSTLVAIVT